MERVAVKSQVASVVSTRGGGSDVVPSVSAASHRVLGVRGVPEAGVAVASLRGDSGIVCRTRGTASLVNMLGNDMPELTSFRLLASGANVYLQSVNWSVPARVRFRCEDLTDGGYVYSDWSSAGTQDIAVNVTGLMVPGNQYRLAYLIDCITDVAGWDDSEYTEFDPQIEWTQPDRFSTPVEEDYSS